MKIQNKWCFFLGVLFAGSLPLFALGVLEADLWQWLLSAALAVKFLCVGLSPTAARRQVFLRDHYEETARDLYGRWHSVKANLPWVLVLVFFAGALAVRYLLDVVIPVWICLAFVVALAVSAAYSIGVSRSIEAAIDARYGSGKEEA